jgi:hypothetical protein
VHETHTERISRDIRSVSNSPCNFLKFARAAALAGLARAVGRAYKIAFTYGMESNSEGAPKFWGALTLQKRHAHITLFVPIIKPAKNHFPLQAAVAEAFTRMPKKNSGT